MRPAIMNEWRPKNLQAKNFFFAVSLVLHYNRKFNLLLEKKLPQQKTDDIQQIKHEKTANFFSTQKKWKCHDVVLELEAK